MFQGRHVGCVTGMHTHPPAALPQVGKTGVNPPTTATSAGEGWGDPSHTPRGIPRSFIYLWDCCGRLCGLVGIPTGYAPKGPGFVSRSSGRDAAERRTKCTQFRDS
jgi:hypothetical protein